MESCGRLSKESAAEKKTAVKVQRKCASLPWIVTRTLEACPCLPQRAHSKRADYLASDISRYCTSWGPPWSLHQPVRNGSIACNFLDRHSFKQHTPRHCTSSSSAIKVWSRSDEQLSRKIDLQTCIQRLNSCVVFLLHTNIHLYKMQHFSQLGYWSYHTKNRSSRWICLILLSADWLLTIVIFYWWWLCSIQLTLTVLHSYMVQQCKNILPILMWIYIRLSLCQHTQTSVFHEVHSLFN